MKHLPHDVLPKPLSFLAKMNSGTSRGKALDIFLKCKELILKEWAKRQQQEKDGERKRSPNDSAVTFIRMNVYRVGIHLIESEQLSVLKDLFPREGLKKNSIPTVDENPFYWVLRYFFTDIPDDMPVQIRNRTAKQLNYAYRHRIPPYLLVGFLYILKDPENISKKEQNPANVEEWFKRLFRDDDFKKGEELNQTGIYQLNGKD